MRWRGRRESTNVEDRRGSGASYGRGGFRIPPMGGRRGGGGRLSGGSIGLLVVFVLVMWALGVNPLELLQGSMGQDGARQLPSPSATTQTADSGTSDEMKRFVSVVLADTEDVWSTKFEENGERYVEPTLVLFTDRVQSACGLAGAASGPFYCPGDQKLYIDLGFYKQLADRFGAPGDFAEAYVIAHEVGHHVQNLLGILPKFHELQQNMSKREANAMSVRVELQADCFAGVWAHYEREKGLLEAGDTEEALTAAAAVGDDAIQRATQGQVVPDSFNHGTSEQRQKWFQTGLDSGEVSACDTFSPQEP
ncbi:KPN_02809 family neutral zinc metallopeptidase [Amorphus sp. MBR-141]